MTATCPDRERLEKELLVAAHQHMLLEEAMKTPAPSQIADVVIEEQRARDAWELAARALKEHRSRHGC
jgi:hypothetical protein